MIREIDKNIIDGLNNIERYIMKEVMDTVGKHNLESVEEKDNKLILTFSDEENSRAKNFVKQLSKKRYKTDEDLVRFYANAPRIWRLLKVIPTQKAYLLFFSEICREQKDIIW